MPDVPPPKIFISYSWTSEVHKQWVLDLAKRLMSSGVEVILDRWDLMPGHDTYAFMEKMVTDITVQKVLMVCDAAYAGKADGRKGGVGTETQIISSEVYSKAEQTKFIPLIRERLETGDLCRPTYLKSRLYIDFTDDERFEESFEELIRLLHRAPELKKPALGKPPSHIFNLETSFIATSGAFRRLKDAAEKAKPHVVMTVHDYLEALTEAVHTTLAQVAAVENEPRDETVIRLITVLRPYRDEFIEFCGLYAGYADTEQSYAEVHAFLERLLQLQAVQADKSREEAIQFAGYEWVLYLFATLIRLRKYATAVKFLDDVYHYRIPRRDGMRRDGISGFFGFVTSLDEGRNERLKLRRLSVVADMIHDSVAGGKISFRDLHQADILLFLRPFLLDPSKSQAWSPRLFGYSEGMGALDIFARAASPAGRPAITSLFSVKTPGELSKRIHGALANPRLLAFANSSRFAFGDETLRELMNWEELSLLTV